MFDLLKKKKELGQPKASLESFKKLEELVADAHAAVLTLIKCQKSIIGTLENLVKIVGHLQEEVRQNTDLILSLFILYEDNLENKKAEKSKSALDLINSKIKPGGTN